MIQITEMKRLVGDEGILGSYYFTVSNGEKTTEVKFNTFPTEREIIDKATLLFDIVILPPEDQTTILAKQIVSQLFAGLDAEKPEDLYEAVRRYRALMAGA